MDRETQVSPELRSMSIGWLVGSPFVFAVTAATAYRPSFDGPGEIALAVLPFVVFAASVVALLAPLRPIPVLVHWSAMTIALVGWTVLLFDNEAWTILTFVLFGMCFGIGQWVGVALAGVVSFVWTVAWAVTARPGWAMLIPFAVFVVGSVIYVTIWRVENTKEIMRRNRELESAYLAQEVTLRQKDKLATLGELSAGMAHELNNPTAAAQQAVKQLSSLLSSSELADAELAGLGLADVEVEVVKGFTARIDDRIQRPDFLDPLERSDRVADVQDHLERAGVDDGWEIAPSLIDLGLSTAEVEDLVAHVRSDRLGAVLSLIAAQHSRASLLRSIDESTGRITELVKALKTYTYLDQAPRQLIDVHEGLDSTLVMLRSRLMPGIEVNRSYADDVPHVEAFGSELNQVWTNILDNAIDAMGGDGAIEITTAVAGDQVIVELSDNGPGIPSADAEQIFDPFFTTKAPGEGTGLGLNISYNIITQKHGGDISLDSEPGRTTFTVRLPITAPAELSGDSNR